MRRTVSSGRQEPVQKRSDGRERSVGPRVVPLRVAEEVGQGRWEMGAGPLRVQLTKVLEGCLSFREAGAVTYEVASVGFGLTSISETNKKCDQAVVLLLLCDADFLWALLHHMVLELNSCLALVMMWLQPEEIP